MGLLEVWNTPEGRYGILYALTCVTPGILAIILYYRSNYVDLD